MEERSLAVNSMPETRHALVTGCSSGLGRAIADRLHRRGWIVHATARTKADRADLGIRGLQPVELELRSSESIRRAAATVLEASDGHLEAVVNNAGYSQLGAVEDVTRDELRDQFETNVFGTIELTNLLLPALRERARGTLVFVSSVCARVPLPYLGTYSASKAALEALVDALRREVRDSPLRVHLLEPGIFNTGCYAATRGHYEGTSASRSSRHADACARVLAGFEKELASIPAERSEIVAQAVEEFLDGRRTAARQIVPTGARVYELARRALPDRWLDAAVSRRRGGR